MDTTHLSGAELPQDIALGGPPVLLAREFCANLELTNPARLLLNGNPPVVDYVHLLAEHKLYDDAIKFLARALPKPAAIWWGCLCTWDILRDAPDQQPLGVATIDAAVKWLNQPTDEQRRATRAQSKLAGWGTMAGLIGLAVFQAEGSMSLPGLPEVAPKPELTAQNIVAALNLGINTAGTNKSKLPALFVQLGLDVLEGRNAWQSDPPPKSGT